MVGCINLKERFGDRYRVIWEESYYAEYGEGARVEDPVYMIIPCKYGHLYLADGDLLAASVDGHLKIAGRLKRRKCCQIHQDGDFGELTVLFNVADFDEVAKIMRPHRRPQFTPEQRAAMAERMRQLRAQLLMKSELSGGECVIGTLDDPEAVQPQPAILDVPSAR